MSAEGESQNLALPVCQDGFTPGAVLLLSAPAFRYPVGALEHTFLEDLRALAARLSYRLGAVVYSPYQRRGTAQPLPAAPLSSAEMNAFLKGPWTARLACVRPDGRPHVIPVWQEWDGRRFLVIAWQGSQWVDFVEQNPNVSITIDEPWSPLRRVTGRGVCVPLEDLQAAGEPNTELPRLVSRLVQRYLGQPASPDLTKQVEKAFSIEPESLIGWQGIPG